MLRQRAPSAVCAILTLRTGEIDLARAAPPLRPPFREAARLARIRPTSPVATSTRRKACTFKSIQTSRLLDVSHGLVDAYDRSHICALLYIIAFRASKKKLHKGMTYKQTVASFRRNSKKLWVANKPTLAPFAFRLALAVAQRTQTQKYFLHFPPKTTMSRGVRLRIHEIPNNHALFT